MTTKTERQRCAWAGNDPLMQAYHDEEWGRPLRDSRALWELLMLEGFQAGLAWITVLRKREGFRRAFRGFDPHGVAKFGEKEIAKLMGDEGIIRARAKIEATIAGAKIYVEMEKADEDFATWAWSLAGDAPVHNHLKSMGEIPAKTERSEAIAKALKQRGFKFVGPTIVYAWMQASGMVDDHVQGCWLYHK